MASLINSIRSLAGDSCWLLKLGVFSAILFYVMDNDLNYPNGNPVLTPVYIVLFVIMLGCASVAMNRNIKNISPIFPNLFDIFDIIIKSVGSVIAIAPGSFLCFYCISLIQKNIIFEPFVMAVIYICVVVFFVPFIFLPVIFYSVNGNIFDAFNVKKIYEASGNFTVQFLSYVLQYFFIICVSTYVIYSLLLGMLGDNVSLLILKCIVIVISFYSFFIFCSDLYGDVIPEIQIKKKKKLKRKIS